nr:crinkler 10 [Plasmopara viticola]
MVKLFCALVGVAGSAFSVQKDESDSVDKLKDAIKKKKSGTIKGEADKLQLFLATTSDNAWLESDSEDVMNLKKGEQNIAIKAMTNEEKEIQGESRVQNVLVGMPEPSTDQIHLLVVIPEQKQAQIELWLATGFVENALTTKGIRSKLYTIAMHRIGYYDPVRRTQDKNVAFWYKGKKLCFHVLFKTSACFFIVIASKWRINLFFGLQKIGLCYSKLM